MSLLNDALRKQHRAQSTDGLPPPGGLSAGFRKAPRRPRLRPAVLACLAAILLAGGGWVLRSPGGTAAVGAAVADPVFQTPAATLPETPVATAPGAGGLPASAAATDPVPTDPTVEPELAPGPPPPADTPASAAVAPGEANPPPPAAGKAVPMPAPALPPAVSSPPATPQEAASPRRLPAAPEDLPPLERIYQQARIHHQKQHFDQAMALYQEVLRLEPRHADARFNLAVAAIAVREFALAHAAAAELLRQEPSNPQVQLHLAMALIGEARPLEALSLLEQAALAPNAPLFAIRLHQGIAHRHLRQLEEATACYRQAERLEPDAPPLLFNLALALDGQQLYEPAMDYYRRYLQVMPRLEAPQRRQVEERIRELSAYAAQQGNREANP
jgi:Tfp pilus assembly protein PilF